MRSRRRRPVEPWRQRERLRREEERARASGEPAPESAPAPSGNGDPFALERTPAPVESLAPEGSPPPRRERRRGPRFNLVTGTLLLSAIALAGGFLVVNLVLMPSFTRQGAEVPVPEVTGLSEREAERVLASEDLRLSKVSEQWSADVPRGFIAAQDPAAGGLVYGWWGAEGKRS